MKKWFRSFLFAINGIKCFYKEETHAKVHTIIALAVIILGWYVGISNLEWCAICLCIGVVISAEIMNTAIERLCDRVTKQHDPLIKKTKDLASGAVLIVSIMSAIIGLIILSPKIIEKVLE